MAVLRSEATVGNQEVSARLPLDLKNSTDICSGEVVAVFRVPAFAATGLVAAAESRTTGFSFSDAPVAPSPAAPCSSALSVSKRPSYLASAS